MSKDTRYIGRDVTQQRSPWRSPLDVVRFGHWVRSLQLLVGQSTVAYSRHRLAPHIRLCRM